jgi:hypothetical protein
MGSPVRKTCSKDNELERDRTAHPIQSAPIALYSHCGHHRAQQRGPILEPLNAETYPRIDDIDIQVFDFLRIMSVASASFSGGIELSLVVLLALRIYAA